ncbi:MAG: hypothetical protein CM1200mP18_17120 [Gammaproteobacteria bacterium]|nr:MAG: hypothetical protein CM1200mP18_17120 [Gammaproteobacteria bacterium]
MDAELIASAIADWAGLKVRARPRCCKPDDGCRFTTMETWVHVERTLGLVVMGCGYRRFNWGSRPGFWCWAIWILFILSAH